MGIGPTGAVKALLNVVVDPTLTDVGAPCNVVMDPTLTDADAPFNVVVDPTLTDVGAPCNVVMDPTLTDVLALLGLDGCVEGCVPQGHVAACVNANERYPGGPIFIKSGIKLPDVDVQLTDPIPEPTVVPNGPIHAPVAIDPARVRPVATWIP